MKARDVRDVRDVRDPLSLLFTPPFSRIYPRYDSRRAGARRREWIIEIRNHELHELRELFCGIGGAAGDP